MFKKSFVCASVSRMSKPRKISLFAAAFSAVLCLTLGIFFAACGNVESPEESGTWGGNNTVTAPYTPLPGFELPSDYGAYNDNYKTNTMVGYSSEILGRVTRNKPVEEIKDGGLASGYPVYGYTLRNVIGGGEEQVAARNALINESSYLTATGTANAGGGNYRWMDKDGYLYNGTTAAPELTYDRNTEEPRRLYKHTASVGLYMGDVSDDEPGIIKRVTMRPRTYNSYGVTGVYAPAGEVIKIEMSEADMEATGGIVIHIGQALYNGQANNIWTEKNQMQRIPHLLNTMVVTKDTSTLENGVYTAYVGSFIGGPLYIRNEGVTFTATITGGVAYSHFILGYTTEKEYEENAKSSAPYFDLEVWHYGVLHSGPKLYSLPFSYDDIYKAAVLWDKVSSVTTTGSSQGIVFLYDPFVAAGAAVAFPGRRSVNCPMGWMANSLNYNSIVNSGAWGNFHEYHHNFQGYGVGGGGEVTNNGMTLVSYSLFTKISSARGSGNFGASGMSGWNRYTSATWALDQVKRIANPDLNPENGNSGLSIYATLLHNFGPDNYIQSKVRQQSSRYGENYTGYLRAWQDITHNDMTYFFKDVLGGIDNDVANQYTNPDYSMFVPVSSYYQTGRSYMYDGVKKYTTTMQPYIIPYGREFTVDLREYVDALTGSIVIPDGFTYTVKNVSQPEHGSIAPTGTDKVYTFSPDINNLRSGKIIVTLGITKDDGAFQVDDVDLVLELEQSHETNKWTTTRTTYTYSPSAMYSSAAEAYEAGYAGYSSVDAGDNINPTLNGRVVQECNSEVWFTTVEPADKVVEIQGKMYAAETGKYRIALRGRWNVALYVSLNSGETYELAATYVQPKTDRNYNFPLTEGTFKDYELEAGSWVYYKAVMLTDNNGSLSSFVGVGWGMFTPELGILDENGELVEVIPETVNVGYVNAYRTDYEFPASAFETDYFYTRKYNYNYQGDTVTVTSGGQQTYIASSSNYSPWEDTDVYAITNLFDGNPDTGIHTARNFYVSANSPAVFTVDAGREITANALVLYPNTLNNNCRAAFPRNFTLQGSLDGVNFFDMGSWTGAGSPQVSSSFGFDTQTFRYYRLTVTATGSGSNRVAFGEIEFTNTFRLNGNGQNATTPDGDGYTFEGDWACEQAMSTFGHVYVGKSGATMSFEFTGTRVGFLSSSAFGKNFEVRVDGVKVESIELKHDDGAIVCSYISELLSDGTHAVTVTCTGEANIDSILVY